MKILIKPRIHITLISMHAYGYRANGGIGFAIEEPKGLLTILPAERFDFRDRRALSFTTSELEQLESAVSDAKYSWGLTRNIQVTFEGGMLTHYGMGSATAVRLACIEALARLNNRTFTRQNLVALSKRGGTSGIGINTYFKGGFVFDLGARKPTKDFIPSSKAIDPQLPLLLDSIDMPDWRIGLCIPTNLSTKTQEEEAEFFERICPIRSEDSYEASYHSLFGAYASVRERNLEGFAKSIKQIQVCEWKHKERSEYGKALLGLENKLYELGALCVGMSSLGPMLFFLSPDQSNETFVDGMKGLNCHLIMTTCANSGRELVF